VFEIDGFRFSKHALSRALDMLLDPKEIVKCLERPVHVEPSRKVPGTDLYFRDRLAITVERDTGVVVTILWRTDSHWRRDLSDKPAYNGRRLRDRRRSAWHPQ
jgi:hypothetical protein